jgi:uncharacterized cysteine cluster protein YcgN (CxxCxxCC family)
MKNSGEFWKKKKLEKLTDEEWESLCDGCAKCCVHKIKFDSSDKVYFTNVACKLLDLVSCRCTKYKNRKKLVPECARLTPENVSEFKWLPSTCAYRLVSEGKELPEWHPLVSGYQGSVRASGMSAEGKLVSEKNISKIEEHIVE